jgi:hypothetical protein
MAIAFPRLSGFMGASRQPLAAGLREFPSRQSTLVILAEQADILYTIIDRGASSFRWTG